MSFWSDLVQYTLPMVCKVNNFLREKANCYQFLTFASQFIIYSMKYVPTLRNLIVTLIFNSCPRLLVSHESKSTSSYKSKAACPTAK